MNKKATTAKANLIYVLVSILLAFLISFIVFKPNYDNSLPLKISDFSTAFLEITDDGIIKTINNHGQMTIDFDSVKVVKSIQINLRNAPGFPWRLQIIYASKLGEGYSEQKSYRFQISENEKNLQLKLNNDEISRLRIDWGDEGDRSFDVDSIVINPFEISTFLLFSFFLAIAFFLAIQLASYIRYNCANNNSKQVVSICFITIVVIIVCILWLIKLYEGNNLFEPLFIHAKNAKEGITLTFTSLNFIFIFLPLSVAIYYLLKEEIRNSFLVLVSIIYYSTSEPTMIWLLLASIFVNYSFSLFLAKQWRSNRIKKILLIIVLIWNFGLLFYFKYYVFTAERIKLLTGSNIIIPEIIQPLGISFFTFRAVSLCLDVYWKTVPVQYSFINVALYISFFPQVAMGPICKYNDFSSQLAGRTFDVDLFIDGIKRFIVGMAKKLIIANNIGGVVNTIFAMNGSDRSVALSWLGILSYLIQLYYDFSGYSDMAIGVGQLFGFRTPENFRYPFISRGVVEYWSRWHITLGTWLKNYIYTPLFRTCQDREMSKKLCNTFALLGVWLFAGVWHGAGWNFVCYGLYYFAFIIIERCVEEYEKKRRKKLKLGKRPMTPQRRILSHLYFFIVLIFGQLLFRCTDLMNFGDYCRSLFGLSGNTLWDSATVFYIYQSIVLLVIGWIFAFPIVDKIKSKTQKREGSIPYEILVSAIYAGLLIVSFAFAMTDTYQAFIYFQF